MDVYTFPAVEGLVKRPKVTDNFPLLIPNNKRNYQVAPIVFFKQAQLKRSGLDLRRNSPSRGNITLASPPFEK